MPEMLAKKADSKATKTKQLHERRSEDVKLRTLQLQEKRALDKLERIKLWPENQRAEATARTEDTLSQIRERMSELGHKTS